ncbi:hypothetical protein BSKO_10593 [Bryopsis sp. KO-2023]|nr:hypothetical protein BSKO_10593 [Bryopsis sp. KO-2023]
MASQSTTASFANIATNAARKAGAIINRAFNETKNVEHKGKVDLVTETDKACEKVVFDAIRSNFPEHKFIGEEESAARGTAAPLTDDPTWMVDPLDGTTNFVHRWPFCCVSIALVVNKEVVVGVVYNPILDEMFTAEKGQGAFLNGSRIHVSDTSDLGSALVATELGVTREERALDVIFERIRRLSAASRSLRCNGSCALNLCGVACGRLDAFFEIGFGGCWDVAAGALVLQEAGGHVLDPTGKPFGLMSRRVLGTNGKLDSIAEILSSSGSPEWEPLPP